MHQAFKTILIISNNKPSLTNELRKTLYTLVQSQMLKMLDDRCKDFFGLFSTFLLMRLRVLLDTNVASFAVKLWNWASFD